MSAVTCFLFGHKSHKPAVVILSTVIRPVGPNGPSSGEGEGDLPGPVDYEAVIRLRKATDKEIREGKAYLQSCVSCENMLIHI